MKFYIRLIFLFILVQGSLGKEFYFIKFVDKGEIAEQLASPENYLSSRALQRRTAQGIAVDSSDVPVLKEYVEGVESSGAIVLYRTKWENGVIAEVHSSAYNTVASLDYVASMRLIKKNWQAASNLQGEKFSLDGNMERASYGQASNQVEMLNADELNGKGYTGQGMFIAMFDAGYRGVNTLPAFAHLYENNQIAYTWHYPDGDSLIYSRSDHGTAVLSVMAAKDGGDAFGIAPDAEYMLVVTEDSEGEYPIEEYFWLVAAEKADSLGVDVINTSLVYRRFNDGADNYSKADLDGNTAVITNAADKAASKGILVVSCAGNDGNSDWGALVPPADGDSILTVGAVNASEVYGAFSSPGPTADDRIKPDVVAQGDKAYVVGFDGIIKSSTGTSLSSPIIAAFAACLWQAHPAMSNMELIDFIKSISSNNDSPNNQIGYGIPRYSPVGITPFENAITPSQSFFSRVGNSITFYEQATFIELYSLKGKLLKRVTETRGLSLDAVASGVTVVKALVGEKIILERLILR